MGGRSETAAVASWTAAITNAAAGVVHLRAAAPHGEEDAMYAAFFYVAAAVELFLAVAFIVARRRRRPVAVSSIVVNLVLVGTWILTRTFGPPIGNDAGQPEAIEAADVVAVVLELIAMAGAAIAVRRPALRLPRLAVMPAIVVLPLAAVPVAVLVDVDPHAPLCEAHADEPYLGPMAAAYGHSMLEPGAPPLDLAVGEEVTVLVGKLINCDNHPVAITGADVINATGGVHVREFLAAPLDGPRGFTPLRAHGVAVPATRGAAELGLFARITATSPGRFGVQAVALEVGDHGETVRQPFATNVVGKVG